MPATIRAHSCHMIRLSPMASFLSGAHKWIPALFLSLSIILYVDAAIPFRCTSPAGRMGMQSGEHSASSTVNTIFARTGCENSASFVHQLTGTDLRLSHDVFNDAAFCRNLAVVQTMSAGLQRVKNTCNKNCVESGEDVGSYGAKIFCGIVQRVLPGTRDNELSISNCNSAGQRICSMAFEAGVANECPQARQSSAFGQYLSKTCRS